MSTYKSKHIDTPSKHISKIIDRGNRLKYTVNKSTLFNIKRKTFDTLKEAQIYLDTELIKLGLEPIHLKKK